MISIKKNFYGRVEELDNLNYYYRKKGFQNIIIYGRRRVGKTTLCLEFLKKKEGIYFLSEKNDFKIQSQRLVNNFAQNNNIFPKNVEDFYDAFEFILENIKDNRYIIILDEFPYLVEENRKILSQFQRIIDELLSNSNIYLILLGSSISIMEQEVLGYKSPLYARRTAQIKVKPLKFEVLFKWFEDKNFEEILHIYSIVDSIPLYIEKIDNNKNFEENLRDNFYNKSNFLFEEVLFLLNSELRETKNYKRILFAIANGKNRLSEIANEAKISVNVLTNYLDTLLNLHILKKDYPITENKELSRNSIYRFKDNYFNFWFKFIFPNLELFEKNDFNEIDNLIFKNYNVYLSFIFEDICRYFVMKIFNYKKTGSWWYKGNEIDICAIDDNKKEILFGEVKYKDNVDAKQILEDLKEKSKSVNWNNEQRKEEFVIIAKSFKDKKIKGVKLYDLFDLENQMLKNL